MTEPDDLVRDQRDAVRINPTLIALIGGVVILLALVWYFSGNRSPDQDKLRNPQLEQSANADPAKRCSAKATYELIKRDLFRRAAQVRGSDQAAFDQIAAAAVLRVENPVLENEGEASGGLNCSATFYLDLPPGVAVVGGRRTLTAAVDYTIQRAADDSGDVVLLRNADPIITPLATLARVEEPAPAPTVSNSAHAASPVEEAPPAAPSSPEPQPVNSSAGRPSFDCARAGTRGEIAVCSDSGLAALDVNMAAQYRRSLASANPAQRQALQSTRDRFLAYRDRCPNRQCMAEAYVGRMREIRDIMEGRWRPR
ncbi:MAG: lysozyme inhibitor LprI family protein [Sphingomicrobium sp.]